MAASTRGKNMKKEVIIDSRFDNLSLSSFNDYFNLGAEKRKKASFYLNGKKIDENVTLHLGDTLTVEYRQEANVRPIKGNLNIVYEDENILIVDKEKGLLVHSDNKEEANLASYVYQYYLEKGEDNILSYLGRLDLDTTGLVIFTKNIFTSAYLDNLVSRGELHRSYYAITTGQFDLLNGQIEKPIGRDRHNAKRMRISSTGKYALTKYEVLAHSQKYNLVYLTLKTGRTHQIRLHLSSIGCPIVGDSLYGGAKCDNLALTSAFVSFYEPISGKLIEIHHLNNQFKSLLAKYKLEGAILYA